MATACSSVPKQAVQFDEASFAPFAGAGTASIVGTAMLRASSGGVEVAAAETVELIPSTPYTRERYEIALRDARKLPPADRRLGKYVRTAVADSEGRFEFKMIPPGDYFIVCTATWDYAATRYGGVRTGKRAVAAISLEDGSTKRVLLSE